MVQTLSVPIFVKIEAVPRDHGCITSQPLQNSCNETAYWSSEAASGPAALSEFKTSSWTCVDQGIPILEIFKFRKKNRQRLLIM